MFPVIDPWPAATVRRVALEEGVNPDLLLSIWQQESGGSTDLNLLGPMTRHGQAQGPFQIMAKFWGEPGESFEEQARLSAKILKQKGVRGYYGEGKAPPGQPTTDQYEQQVMARIPGAGPLLAGDMTYPPGLYSRGQAPQRAPQMDESTFLGDGTLSRLMADPLLLMGASILANNRPGATAGEAIGSGIMGGLGAAQAMQSNNTLQAIRMQQVEMARRKAMQEAQELAMRQQLLQSLGVGAAPAGGAPGAPGPQPMAGGPLPGISPEQLVSVGLAGTLAGIEGFPSVLSAGTALRGQNLQYGAMTPAQQAEAEHRAFQRQMDVQRGIDEGWLPQPGQQALPAPQAGAAAQPQLPAAAPDLSPRAAREAAGEAVKVEAKKRAELRVELPKLESTTALALQTVDDLLKHPGREWATGMSAVVPLVPGTAAYDFNAKLLQAQGQVFLRAYETLKGGGQITEVEGKKAEQATAALDRAQSEKQFVKALEDLRDALASGLRKAREAAGVQGDMESPAAGVDFRFEGGRLVPAR